MKTDLAAQFQTPGLSAYDVARLTYAQCRPYAIKSFEEEFAEHLRDGFVMVLPSEFLLARAVEIPHDGRIAWLITHAIGNLSRLMAAMPFPLDWIAFSRGHGDTRMRIYPLERFCELSLRVRGRRLLNS